MPFKGQDNLNIPIEKLLELMADTKRVAEMNEKFYAFAQFLPPGKHNTCLVYNTTNIPKKDIYSFTTVVRPREEMIKISKIRN